MDNIRAKKTGFGAKVMEKLEAVSSICIKCFFLSRTVWESEGERFTYCTMASGRAKKAGLGYEVDKKMEDVRLVPPPQL